MLVPVAVIADRGPVQRLFDDVHGDSAVGLPQYHLNTVSARRASPADSCTNSATASSSMVVLPFRPRGSTTARCTSTDVVRRQQLQLQDQRPRNSGATNRNDGFSSSGRDQQNDPILDGASSASCWVFEKESTSSMNRTVCHRPAAPTRDIQHRRTSFTPADSADSASNRRPGGLGDHDAKVVLPRCRAAPYRITDAAPGTLDQSP